MSTSDTVQRSNVGPQASLFHGTESPFVYNSWSSIINFGSQHVDVNPQSDTATQTVFQIDQHGDHVGHLELMWDMSAIAAGGGGTYRRFCDWWPLAYINYIDLNYGSTHVQRIWGDEMHHKINLTCSIEEILSKGQVLFGLLGPIQRNNLALATQSAILNLNFFFTINPDKYFPQMAMAHQLRITVNWNPLTYIVQSDDAAPATSTRSTPVLRVHHYNSDMATRQTVTLDTQSQHGLVINMDDIEFVPDQLIANGTPALTNIDIPIRALKSPTKYIIFGVRPRSCVTGTSTQIGPFENYVALTNFQVNDGSAIEVSKLQEHVYNRHLYTKKFFPHVAGVNLYVISWSLNPMDHNNNWGSAHLGNFNNLTLRFQLVNGPLTEDHRLDLFAVTKNNTQYIHGNLLRVWL